MKIALFVGQINLDSQRKIIQGVYSLCKKNNIDLHLYALFSTTEMKFNIGEFEYLNRIDFGIYDGFIVYTETLYSLTLKEMLMAKLETYNKYTISIDNEVPNCTNILTDNIGAMEKIVEDLITKKKVKVLNFISGPLGSKDSELRKKAFVKVLTKYNLNLDLNRMYIGDFFADSGEKAIQQFEESGVLNAEVYVCANDQMALGALYALKKKGINVPKDCYVTGFDNIIQAEYNVSPITSVARHEYDIGQLAFNKLMSLLSGDKIENIKVNSEPIFRDENFSNFKDINNILEYYSKKDIDSLKYANIISNSASSFLTAKTINELTRQIIVYLNELNIKDFSICLDADKLSKKIDSYQYLKGDVIYEQIEKVNLFPSLKKVSSGEFFIIAPLHFMDKYFGYTISKNIFFPLESDIYYRFLTNISNSLESIEHIEKMNTMIKMLEETSLYDPLTKLKNRNGFFKEADVLFEEAKKGDESLYLLFADLDGLKAVNDDLGHKLGDDFICDFANVLQTICKNEIVMRFGGDEFVVLGKNKSKVEALKEINEIQNRLTQINNSNLTSYRPYKLSASIGYFIVDTKSNLSLLNIIDKADEDMYKKKKRKKASQNKV